VFLLSKLVQGLAAICRRSRKGRPGVRPEENPEADGVEIIEKRAWAKPGNSLAIGRCSGNPAVASFDLPLRMVIMKTDHSPIHLSYRLSFE